MSNFNISFPIDMIKREQRIVVGIATADNIDKSGDIVDFEASKEAFANWGGNIREMHAPIAVGKAIGYESVVLRNDDGIEYNAFKVEAYISKGAESTWQKVLDGTLRSFSIGGKVLEKSESADKKFNGKPVNVIKKYVLGELSLVDNPANSLAVIDLVKINKDGGFKYALDCDLDCQIAKAKQPIKDPKGGLTAAGRRHFKQTEGANLKPGVRGAADTPEKMRRKGSFLTRFFTNPSGPMKKPNGEPTRLALSAAAWGEPVPQDRAGAARLAAKGRRLLERYARTKEKADVENSFEDELSFEDALLEQIGYILKDENYGCGCEDCNGLEKDVSVTTEDVAIKNPSRSDFISPTIPKYPKGKKKILKEEGPCWDGFHQEGEKKGKNGNMVPNCVANKSVKKNNVNINTQEEKYFDIIKEMIKDMESIIKQDSELQINNTYDMLSDMNEQESGKLNLLKKFVGWLVPDVAEEIASNTIEVNETTQEEEMDINMLKEALSAVVDEKLAGFATSIKEEVEASVQAKIETVAKGFEAQTIELEEKLSAAEVALAEQTEKVAVISAAGAAKKSVDPEDEDDSEKISKAVTPSFWKNTYLPQELINSLGYKS